MEGTMGNEGINMLAGQLQNRMHVIGDKPQALDFGSIQGDMSLLTNRFPKPIPQSDYMVCRCVTYNPARPLTESWWVGETAAPPHAHGVEGEHDHAEDKDGKHYHDICLPNKMRWLEPGDRVLVAWVGDDACVVDLIFPATVVG